MVFWGRKRLFKESATPRKSVKNRLSLQDLIEAYEISRSISSPPYYHDDSAIAGMTVAQSLLRTRYGVTVLGIERQQRGRTLIMPARTRTELKVGDIILVVDTAAELDRIL